MIVYYAFNRKTWKGYVGQTSRTAHERFDEHCENAKYSASTYFHRALNKYGRDSFVLFAIAEVVTRDEANRIEIETISRLNSNDKTCGYNMTSGGEGISKGYKHSADVRKRFSKEHSLKGRKGKPHSDEAKLKMSISSTGRKHTIETREKMSSSRTGLKNALGSRHSETQRQAKSERQRGLKRSEESRRRMSEAAIRREERKRTTLAV